MNRILLKYTIVFYLLLLPSSLLAQNGDTGPCSVPPDIKVSRPNESGPPTVINMGFYLLDLKEIKDSDGTFTADILVDAVWNDPRLSKKSLGKSLFDCELPLKAIWFPKILDINKRSGESKFDDVVNINDKGDVRFLKRIIGIFDNNYEYNEFPFDTQTLHITIASYDYGPQDLVFKVNREKLGMKNEMSLEGWDNIELLEPTVETINIEGENRNISRIDFRINAERNKGYYIWKIILPLCFIVLMAWAVFWIPPSAIAPQVGLSTATIFTLIAYRFSIGFQLPQISYFTRMDKFVFACTLIVFIALAVAIGTSNMASKGELERALKIEKVARLIYLILFIVILIWSLVL